MLEVNRKPKRKADAAPESWPASLYAKPRRQAVPPITAAPIVPDEILEGCRLAMQQLGTEGLTSLGVTSATRGEGRTTIALAIGLVLAEYGFDTVLAEMDLAHPQLAHQLSVAKYPGVVDLAEGVAAVEDVLRPIAPGLSLIPAGQLTSTVPRVMSQLARSEVVGELVENGHVVVADLPPLLSNSSGHQAAALMADVILVVRARTVPAGAIGEAVNGLDVKPKVLVNGTHSRVPDWALRLAGI